MKILYAFLLSVLFQIIYTVTLGKLGFVEFLHQYYNDSDSYYVFDLIFQHQTHNAALGSNPMILGDRLSWIHWSGFYLELVNITSLFLENFLAIDNSIIYSAIFWTVGPTIVLGTVLFKWMFNHGASFFTTFMFGGIFYINMYIMNYCNYLCPTHHALMLCFAGLFLISTLAKKPKYYVSGLLASLSMWVSPEIFPVILSGIGIYCFRKTNDTYKASLVWCISSLLMVCLNINPSPNLPWYAPDRIDLAYVILPGIITILTFFTSKNNIMSLMAISVSTAIWIFTIPHLSEGVHGFIPPDLYKEWYRHVHEILSVTLNLLFFEELFCLLVLFTVSIVLAIKDIMKKEYLSSYLCLVMIIYFAMGIQHNRSMLEFILVDIVFSFYIIMNSSIKINKYFTIFLNSLIICYIINLNVQSQDMLNGADINSYNKICDMREVSSFLSDYKDTGVLIPINKVAALLWYTRNENIHSFAGGYHRDTKSMQTDLNIFRTYKEDKNYQYELSLLDKYSIKHIIVCTGEWEMTEYFPWRHFDNLFDLLSHNDTKLLPKNIKLATSTHSGWKIYQVN